VGVEDEAVDLLQPLQKWFLVAVLVVILSSSSQRSLALPCCNYTAASSERRRRDLRGESTWRAGWNEIVFRRFRPPRPTTVAFSFYCF